MISLEQKDQRTPRPLRYSLIATSWLEAILTLTSKKQRKVTAPSIDV